MKAKEGFLRSQGGIYSGEVFLENFFNDFLIRTDKFCSVKKVFLEMLQNSPENICARVSLLKKQALAQVFSCEFCKISKNTFYSTRPVAACRSNQSLAEAVARRCSVKMALLKTEFCEIFKNTYFYRTPLVVASALVHPFLVQSSDMDLQFY